MKKVSSVLIALLLLIFSTMATVFAAADPVSDMAGLLTQEQETELTSLLLEQGIGTLCVVTVDSLEGEDVETYAENWADSTGVGVVFLVAIQERKWCITSSGAYEGAIDGYVIDCIGDICVPYLSSGDYYGAFVAFSKECSYYLDGYDPDEQQSSENTGFGTFLVCLMIGLAAGGITAGIMAGKNRSVRQKDNAADYVRRGSLTVNVSRDIYLYHHVVRTPKPQNNSSSGGSGGSRSTRSGSF